MGHNFGWMASGHARYANEGNNVTSFSIVPLGMSCLKCCLRANVDLCNQFTFRNVK